MCWGGGGGMCFGWMIKHLLDAAMADIDLFSLAKIISN